MKILYGVSKIPRLNKPIITIGVFDGVHVGHQKLLKKLVKKARRKKRKSVIITFKPHPYRVLRPHKTPPMLLSLSHRLKLLEMEGINIAVVLDFDKRLMRLSPEAFIKNILIGIFDTGELYVGEKFTLGYKKKGDAKTLKRLCLKYGFNLNVVKYKRINGQSISSTLIRKLVTEGRLREAAKGLGRRVSLLGTVARGDGRGRILGFPTSNLDLHHEAVPPAGVYAVLARLDKKNYNAVVNIGFRPTFKRYLKERTVEVHIFDFNKKIYGRDLEIIFVKKIREERRFKNRNHIREQIKKDIKQAKKALAYV